jgi:hypothetical protein
VIFNAVIIIALIPLALKGLTYKPVGAAAILRRSLLIYGLGGVLLPFIGIKVIDVLLVAVGLAWRMAMLAMAAAETARVEPARPMSRVASMPSRRRFDFSRVC